MVEGEEVLFSYIDDASLAKPVAERHTLLAQYLFTCACERCAADR